MLFCFKILILVTKIRKRAFLGKNGISAFTNDGLTVITSLCANGGVSWTNHLKYIQNFSLLATSHRQ